ncbi:MAG: WhiB family transcriptional regulator [Actinobacteria bacterium]|nr:WhiB family transcriptional regulator [Actinomycetota bacterium]
MKTTIVSDSEDLERELLGLLRRPHWQSHAACRGMGAETFFPAEGLRTSSAVERFYANLKKAFCDNCPVCSQCLAAGLDEAWGLWGGLSPVERRRLPGKERRHDAPRGEARVGQ